MLTGGFDVVILRVLAPTYTYRFFLVEVQYFDYPSRTTVYTAPHRPTHPPTMYNSTAILMRLRFHT